MKRRTKQIRHKTSAARKIRPVPFYIFIIEFSSDIRIDAIPPVNESENLFPKRYRPDKLTVEQLFIRFAEFYDGRFACGDHDLSPVSGFTPSRSFLSLKSKVAKPEM